MEVVTSADHHLPDAVDATGTAALPTSGLAALSLIARLHHISTDANTLGHQLNIPPSRDITAQELLLAAKHIGLKAKLTSCTADRLHLQPLPALALMRDEQGDKKSERQGNLRYVLIAQCDGQRLLMQDPSAASGGRPTIEPVEVFAQQ